MNTFVQIAAVLALILGLLGTMAGLSHLARARSWHPEVARKIVHVAASGIAIPLPWLFPETWPVWLLLALALAAMLAMRTPLLAGPGRALHSVARKSWGDVLLVVSVGLVLLLYRGEAVLYVLPLLVLALGDAAAALTGSAYGRNFYRTEDGSKSVEGSTMFFLVVLILSMVCLLLLTDMARGTLILVSLGVAVFATVIEADSWRGFDNLFLPMGVFLFLWRLTEAPGGESLARMVPPLAAMALAYGVGRAAGMNLQVARIHAVAMFLILSATDLWNAVLPALVLVVHGAVASRRPGEGLAAETLDMVAGLAVLSFGFLALDPAVGQSAINFYGLACAAVAVAQFGRGLAGLGRGRAAAGTVLFAAVVWVLWIWLTGLNSPRTHWHGPIGIPGAAILGLVALATTLRPTAFTRAAGRRIALLGAVPALLLFGACLLLTTSGTT